MSVEQTIKISDNSTPIDYKEKLAVLFAWQQIYDERIGRLFILTLGVFSFYLYFGVIAPNTSKSLVDKLEVARNDLEKISDQYKLLRTRYLAFSSQPNAAVPINIFSDTIIPSIQTNGNNELGKLSEDEKVYLTEFSKDLKILSELYKKRNRNKTVIDDPNIANNERFREQMVIFRETLGSLITGKYDTSQSEVSEQTPYEVTKDAKRTNDKLVINKLNGFLVDGRVINEISPDDPINDLENLDKLEQVIQNMIKLSGSPVNSSLMEKARKSLDSKLRASFSSTNSGVYFGDTVTQSFAPYESVMQDYTSPSEIFKFTSDKNLSSYKVINEYLDRPFRTNKIEDLDRLKIYTDKLISNLTSEEQSSKSNVPIINVSVDRTVILIFLPILILSLIYPINIYVYRYYDLISEISHIKNGPLSINDIVKFAPIQFFYHFNQLAFKKLKFSKIFSLSISLNKYFSKILLFIFLLIPLWTALIFSYGLYNQRFGIAQSWRLGFIFLGIIIVILMSIEFYLIYCCLTEITANKEIKDILLGENTTNFSNPEIKSVSKQVSDGINKKTENH